MRVLFATVLLCALPAVASAHQLCDPPPVVMVSVGVQPAPLVIDTGPVQVTVGRVPRQRQVTYVQQPVPVVHTVRTVQTFRGAPRRTFPATTQVRPARRVSTSVRHVQRDYVHQSPSRPRAHRRSGRR